jgi:hypothetical protein
MIRTYSDIIPNQVNIFVCRVCDLPGLSCGADDGDEGTDRRPHAFSAIPARRGVGRKGLARGDQSVEGVSLVEAVIRSQRGLQCTELDESAILTSIRQRRCTTRIASPSDGQQRP